MAIDNHADSKACRQFPSRKLGKDNHEKETASRDCALSAPSPAQGLDCVAEGVRMMLPLNILTLERIWFKHTWDGTRWYQRSCQWFKARRERIVGGVEANRKKCVKFKLMARARFEPEGGL